MILVTAKRHFDEDIVRARSIYNHAMGLPSGLLKDDLLRSAWMVGVGASDAFFCDAYADLVSRTLRAKALQQSGNLPDRLGNLRVPIVAVLNSTSSWQWRMAARELIEKESVLSIEQIKNLFNVFCRNGHKIMTAATIEPWILHGNSKQRYFGVTRHSYTAATYQAKATLRESALKQFVNRAQTLFQRRHDCIHNCDRPKTALQSITPRSSEKAIDDMAFLVGRCIDHLRGEYPLYLRGCGFSGVTRNSVGA